MTSVKRFSKVFANSQIYSTEGELDYRGEAGLERDGEQQILQSVADYPFQLTRLAFLVSNFTNNHPISQNL